MNLKLNNYANYLDKCQCLKNTLKQKQVILFIIISNSSTVYLLLPFH